MIPSPPKGDQLDVLLPLEKVPSRDLLELIYKNQFDIFAELQEVRRIMSDQESELQALAASQSAEAATLQQLADLLAPLVDANKNLAQQVQDLINADALEDADVAARLQAAVDEANRQNDQAAAMVQSIQPPA